MERKIQNIIAHPFLLGAYSILFMYQHNINHMTFNIVFLPLILTLCLSLIIFTVLRRALRDSHRAGLITSICIALFFTFGHLFDFAKFSLKLTFLNQDHYFYFALLWLSILTLFVLIILRSSRTFGKLTLTLNIITAVLFTFTTVQIAFYKLRENPAAIEKERKVIDFASNPKSENLPDIYYIILDGYTGSFILEDYYGFSNAEFTGFLEKNGFFVAKYSKSNYIMTIHSLASSLNMKYLNYLSPDKGTKRTHTEPILELSNNSLVASSLKKAGYKYIQYGSGYSPTNFINEHADQNMTSIMPFNEFTLLLIDTSLLKIFFKRPPSHRKIYTVPSTLAMLNQNIKAAGPKFVVAHIMSPHPPFLFKENGATVKNPITELDNWRDDESYVQEIKYLNSKVKSLVLNLLNQSATPPVIILQADHGCITPYRYSHHWPARASILNAYYLPSGCRAYLYNSISPVNSFRVLLNCLFGTNLKMLEDKSYFTSWEEPYKFIDISDKVIVKPSN